MIFSCKEDVRLSKWMVAVPGAQRLQRSERSLVLPDSAITHLLLNFKWRDTDLEGHGTKLGARILVTPRVSTHLSQVH